MLKGIRRFFEQHMAERPEEREQAAQERARLAAAALLVEVVRSDEHYSDDERSALLGSVQSRFGLPIEEARQLLELAEVESREAHDLHQFTSQINAAFSPERKVKLIEELWRAAYADEQLHRYEEHLIRRVADLLHVPHSAFIATKLRVLDSAGRA